MTLDFARRVEVALRLNGHDLTTVVSPRTTLLDWLRDDIGLTGTKKGCNEGACGTCTVLVDGQRMNGCLTLVVQCAGRAVTTVEGLAGGATLSPVQAGFHEEHGLQCGFCTPGMMMTSYALLKSNPSPSGHDIRWGISGNLCRCTGYVNIVKAIQYAAQKPAE